VGIIKREFLAAMASGAKFPAFSYIFASLDGAFTEDEQNDPSALTIWGHVRELRGQHPGDVGVRLAQVPAV